jgi:hypothetical protein
MVVGSLGTRTTPGTTNLPKLNCSLVLYQESLLLHEVVGAGVGSLKPRTTLGTTYLRKRQLFHIAYSSGAALRRVREHYSPNLRCSLNVH